MRKRKKEYNDIVGIVICHRVPIAAILALILLTGIIVDDQCRSNSESTMYSFGN